MYKMQRLIEESVNGTHILYCFEELDQYILNAVSYITSGIEKGQHIIFIENEKIFFKLYTILSSGLDEKQLAKVHYINNFDYYCSGGELHPPTTVNYFYKAVAPYYERNISFRIWGHVEWGQQEDIMLTLEKFENAMDNVISENAIHAVCAYDAVRVTDSLKDILMSCHEYFMTDFELVRLPLYPYFRP